MSTPRATTIDAICALIGDQRRKKREAETALVLVDTRIGAVEATLEELRNKAPTEVLG